MRVCMVGNSCFKISATNWSYLRVPSAYLRAIIRKCTEGVWQIEGNQDRTKLHVLQNTWMQQYMIKCLLFHNWAFTLCAAKKTKEKHDYAEFI